MLGRSTSDPLSHQRLNLNFGPAPRFFLGRARAKNLNGRCDAGSTFQTPRSRVGQFLMLHCTLQISVALRKRQCSMPS
jgi:hypothetical protein